MVIKATVTPEEKARIKELAGRQSISSYIKERALCRTDPPPLMQFIETQALVAQRMNEIATTVLTNRVIYETEILELMNRMAALEATTADFLKEVSQHGCIG